MRSLTHSLSVVLMLGTVSLADPRPTTQPTFEELPAMELAGIATFDTPKGGLITKLWDHFPADVMGQPGVSTEPYCYGVSLIVPTTQEKQGFSYLAAGQITDAAKVPLHLLRAPVPAGTYAVFKLEHGLPDGLNEMMPMFNFIFNEWLPNAGYVMAAPMNIERYAMKDNSIAILIPVKKK